MALKCDTMWPRVLSEFGKVDPNHRTLTAVFQFNVKKDGQLRKIISKSLSMLCSSSWRFLSTISVTQLSIAKTWLSKMEPLKSLTQSCILRTMPWSIVLSNNLQFLNASRRKELLSRETSLYSKNWMISSQNKCFGVFH